jgi:hypothetical protein
VASAAPVYPDAVASAAPVYAPAGTSPTSTLALPGGPAAPTYEPPVYTPPSGPGSDDSPRS